jgi:hypothetical protein
LQLLLVSPRSDREGPERGTIGFDGTRSRGVGHRDDSFSSRAGGQRAIALATKDSSGSDRVGTVTDDRIRPEGAFAAAGIRQSVFDGMDARRRRR